MPGGPATSTSIPYMYFDIHLSVVHDKSMVAGSFTNASAFKAIARGNQNIASISRARTQSGFEAHSAQRVSEA